MDDDDVTICANWRYHNMDGETLTIIDQGMQASPQMTLSGNLDLSSDSDHRALRSVAGDQASRPAMTSGEIGRLSERWWDYRYLDVVRPSMGNDL